MHNPLHKKRLFRRAKPEALPAFQCGPKLSAVQISAGTLATFAGLQMPPPLWPQLASLNLGVLIGFASDFRRLLDSIASAVISVKSVDRAVVVLVQCGDTPLAESLRSELWDALCVPVYEVFLSATGYPLALECEAHDGWHVEPGLAATMSFQEVTFEAKTGERFQTGLRGAIVAEPCPCGRPGFRLMSVQPQQPLSCGQQLESAAA